ncbi:MAG: SH3 domain-containing protein [Chloroflexi bacterium]|nr:SH3 domain-containing protein [Chloroflexota bacterium]
MHSRKLISSLTLVILALVTAALACNLKRKGDDVTTTTTAVASANAPTIQFLTPALDGANYSRGQQVKFKVRAQGTATQPISRVELRAKGVQIDDQEADSPLATFDAIMFYSAQEQGTITLEAIAYTTNAQGVEVASQPAQRSINVLDPSSPDQGGGDDDSGDGGGPSGTPIVLQPTATTSPYCIATVLSSGLRFRAGPGTNYDQLTNPSNFQAGEQLFVLAYNNQGGTEYPLWWQVRVSSTGQTGWVAGSLVQTSGQTCGTIPFAQAPPPPTPQATGPDLIVLSISGDAEVQLDSDNTAQAEYRTRIKNTGDTTAQDVWVEITLPNGSTHWENVTSLASNAELDVPTTGPLAADFTQQGNFTIVVSIDPFDTVDEQEEANNSSVLPIRVNPPPQPQTQPDLVVQGVSGDPDLQLGVNGTVQAEYRIQIANIGDAAVQNFSVTLSLLSLGSPVYNPVVVVVQTSLAPNSELDIPVGDPLLIPFNQSGDFELRVDIDQANDVSEKDEENNSYSYPIGVDPSPQPQGCTAEIQGTVNVRTGPSTGYPAIDTTTTGSQYSVTGYNDQVDGLWYQINYGGEPAWVSGQLVQLQGDCSIIGFEDAPPLACEAVVQTDGTQVRNGPSTAYNQIGTVNTGTQLPITGYNDVISGGVRWYQVTYGGLSSWITSESVSIQGNCSAIGPIDVTPLPDDDDDVPPDDDDDVQPDDDDDIPLACAAVIQGALNVRTGPSTAYDIIDMANAGAQLPITGYNDVISGIRWYQVNFGGQPGWVSGEFVVTQGDCSALGPIDVEPPPSGDDDDDVPPGDDDDGGSVPIGDDDDNGASAPIVLVPLGIGNAGNLQPVATGIPTTTGAVNALAFSQDSILLAIAGSDAHLRVWNMNTDTEVVDLTPGGNITDVAFSPNGSLLAAGVGNEVVVWDAGGTELVRLDHGAQVNAVAFNATGTLLASGGGNASDVLEGRVQLWDTTTFDPITPDAGVEGEVTGVGFVENDSLLVVSSYELSRDCTTVGDGGMEQYLVSTGIPSKTFVENSGRVTDLALSPNRSFVAGTGQSELCAGNGVVWVWNAAGTIQNTFDHGVAQVNVSTFNQDGMLVVAGTQAGAVRVWNRNNNATALADLGMSSAVTAVAISPDGLLLVAGDANGNVQAWGVPQ